MSWNLYSSSGVQAYGFSQLCLPLIERPELLSSQLKCASHVQRIESPDAKQRTVSLGEAGARLPGLIGKIPVFPDARTKIAFEAVPCQLSRGK